MNNEFLSLLPDSLVARVEAIEKRIGYEIPVTRGSTAAYQGRNACPPIAMCICDQQGGRCRFEIILTKEAAPHSLAHEVLHGYRAIVAGVPRLVSATLSASLVEALENDVEHLFIIPEEISLCGEAVAFWEQAYADHFRELKTWLVNQSGSDYLAIRHAFIRHRLVAERTLPQWSGHEELKGMLVKQRWMIDADKLVDAVLSAGDDKARIAAAVIQSGGLPLDQFRLRHWDVQLSLVSSAYSALPTDA